MQTDNTFTSSGKISRRKFSTQSVAGLAGAAWLGRVHQATGAQGTESGRLRLASIGVGGMGASDLAALSSHDKVDIVALCDVDSLRLAAAKAKHPMAATFRDYREMLKAMHDKIDAVHVSTPDHTHASAAMAAMNQQKHVYCQKPLTHDVYEARQLSGAAKSNPKLVTQMGTQIHSHTAYRTAVALVQSRTIGKVKEVHSWSNKTWGYDGPDPVAAVAPEHLDWNLWLGSAAERPYAEGHFHPSNWRRWYDFGCGTMGDMAIHILDPVFTALKLGAPHKIVSSSPIPPTKSYGLKNQTTFSFGPSEFVAEGFVLTWSDGGLMPDTTSWPTRTDADGKPIKLPGQGSMFVGEKGYMLLPHIATPILLPEESFSNHKIEMAPNGNHYHLFVDACLGGNQTTAHFGYAGPLTEAVLLGVLANRFPGRELIWDAENLAITNFTEVQRLLRRQYRSGFEVGGL
jgi:Oxidoreductase family, NAD-binding Rossmann fold/Oxidoreductase family, C-terminal alpha/beta domain